MSRSTSWRAVQEAIVAASAADLLRAAIQLCSVAQLRALNQQPIAVAEGETHWLVQLQLLALPPAPLHGLPPPLPLPSESSAADVCSAPSFAPAPMAAAAPRGALLQAAPEEFKQAAPPAPADAGVARGGAELSKEQPSLAGDAERGVEDKHQPAAAAAGGPLPRSVEGAATPRSVQRLTTRQLRRVLSSRGVPFPRAAAHAECVRLCEENGIRSVSDEELERADWPFAAAATTTGKRQAVEEGETRREGEATGGVVKDEQLARSPPQEETRGAAAGREGFGEEEEVGRAAREALEGPRVEEVEMEATLAVQPGEGLLESSPGGTREWIQGMTEESDPQGVEAAEEGESTREEVLDAANGDAAVREDGPPAGGALSGGDEAGAGEEDVGGEAAIETEPAAGGEEVAPEVAFEGGEVAEKLQRDLAEGKKPEETL
ncbi:hypothetical protein AB1Y20_002965 [Prymnesium parvum]|uniref:Peroxin-14 n=1 Tax=Prymnesium parvum TaxID=97485 RepID=A0AB34JCG6_PRYPA